MLPSSSHLRTITSISSPTFASSLAELTSFKDISRKGIIPSDFPPTSTITSSSWTWITVPFIISPRLGVSKSAISASILANDSSRSSSLAGWSTASSATAWFSLLISCSLMASCSSSCWLFSSNSVILSNTSLIIQSGVDAPAVIATAETPCKQSAGISDASRICRVLTPVFLHSLARVAVFELFGSPRTIIRSAPKLISRAACCLFWVAEHIVLNTLISFASGNSASTIA